MRIGRLGILLHPAKAEARALAGEVCDACRHVGMEAVAIGAATQLDEQIDAVAVLGGDGTILRALRLMHGRMLPVLGVNLGTMGFLAECAPEGVVEAVARLARGEYRTDERMRLRVSSEGLSDCLALNDVAISRGSCQRVVRAEIFVNGQPAAAFDGDGAVIASPPALRPIRFPPAVLLLRRTWNALSFPLSVRIHFRQGRWSSPRPHKFRRSFPRAQAKES